jgi:hypothetical protein
MRAPACLIQASSTRHQVRLPGGVTTHPLSCMECVCGDVMMQAGCFVGRSCVWPLASTVLSSVLSC